MINIQKIMSQIIFTSEKIKYIEHLRGLDTSKAPCGKRPCKIGGAKSQMTNAKERSTGICLVIK